MTNTNHKPTARQVRAATLAAAQIAARRGLHATARELFASCGIEYTIPATK